MISYWLSSVGQEIKRERKRLVAAHLVVLKRSNCGAVECYDEQDNRINHKARGARTTRWTPAEALTDLAQKRDRRTVSWTQRDRLSKKESLKRLKKWSLSVVDDSRSPTPVKTQRILFN